MDSLVKWSEVERKQGTASVARASPSLVGLSFAEDVMLMWASMWRPWFVSVTDLPEPPELDVLDEGEAVVPTAECSGPSREVEIEVAGELVTVDAG
jgi:hypothetical protein